VNLGLAAFLIFVLSGSPAMLIKPLTRLLGLTIWIPPDQPIPEFLLAAPLLALIGIRLIAAGAAKETGPELDTLLRHQRWSWLHGDPLNVLLSFIEGQLVKRQAVQAYRRTPAGF
jgi:hypothetical protein